MQLKDILVHLDATEQAATRLAVAAQLAREHGAHLTGLGIIDLVLPVTMAADASGGAVLADLLESMRQQALEQAALTQAMFEETLRREGLAGGWRLVEGAAGETLALHARYADLVVLGQHDPAGSQPDSTALLEAALFDSGRPVLVVPHAGRFGRVGQRVLVGWNASRESARAVHDALPLMARAAGVTLLVVNPRHGPDGHGDEPGADIAAHLARHGLKVRAEQAVLPEVADADALLNRAAELSADLLVVGAYGHSRLREFVLGGVTRTLLAQMTLPVLMAH